MKIRIRKATRADLDRIMVIEKTVFNDPWSLKHFEYELEENPFVFFLVLEKALEVIGYIDFWITFDTCQIANLAISKADQHQGYASLLMDRCIEEALSKQCRNISLEVRVSNRIAQQFYLKYRFIPVTIRKQYYQDGEDAYLMVKLLE